MPTLAERIATATTKLDTERTAENLSNAAILQRIAGNTTEALQLLQELVEQRTNGNAAAPLLTAQALLDLGSLQRSIGDAPQARLSLEKALALQQAHDPHSSQVADILLILSTITPNQQLRLQGLTIVCNHIHEETSMNESKTPATTMSPLETSPPPTAASTATSTSKENHTRSSVESLTSSLRSSSAAEASIAPPLPSSSSSSHNPSSSTGRPHMGRHVEPIGKKEADGTSIHSTLPSTVPGPGPQLTLTPPHKRRESFIDLDDGLGDDEVGTDSDIPLSEIAIELQMMYTRSTNNTLSREDIEAFKDTYLKMEGTQHGGGGGSAGGGGLGDGGVGGGSSRHGLRRRKDLNEALDSDEAMNLCVLSCTMLEKLIQVETSKTMVPLDSTTATTEINMDKEQIINKHHQLSRQSKLGTAAVSSPILMKRSSKSSGKTHQHARAVSTIDSFQPLVRGYLSKMSSSSFRGWQRRWFVLRKYLSNNQNSWNYEVRYWRSEKDEKNKKPIRGRFPVNQILKIVDKSNGGKKYSFSIMVSTTSALGKKKVARKNKRTYYLDSSSEEEKSNWMNCLSAALREEQESEEEEEEEEEEGGEEDEEEREGSSDEED
jgi:hypothetical protein